MNTNDTTTSTAIAAHNLKPGMVASLPHYNHGEPTEIATVEAFGPHLTRLTFVDYAETNTAYTMDRNKRVDVVAVELEMWTVDPTGVRDVKGDTYVMRFPSTMRRHDMLRTLASFALATPVPLAYPDGRDAGSTYVRVPRRFIRVNSTQGVAWDTRNYSGTVAYFNN